MTASPVLATALNLAISVSLLAQTPLPSPAQSKPGDDDVVRVTTNLVQVDAVVTDKNGKQVTDLRPEDFEILEDGHPQKITSFSYVSTDLLSLNPQKSVAGPDRNNPPVPAAPLSRDQVRRTIVLVVDDLGLSLQSMQMIKSALRRFVDEQMQKGDLVAILNTGGGAGALQRLTSDRQQLKENIDRLRWSCHSRVGVKPLAVKDPFFGLKTGQCRPVGGLDQTVKALIYAAGGLKTLPGRKTMLFFTDSFEVLKNPDSMNRDQNVKASIDIDHIGEKIDQMAQAGDGGGLARNYSGDLMGMVLQLIDESNAASTVIYAVDARGLVVTGPTAQDSGATTFSAARVTELLNERQNQVWETQTGLLYLAHQTSGFTILNNNDLGQGVDRIMADLKGYYLIGYRPSDGTFAKRKEGVPYHKLALRMLRPGLRVRSRTGFYGATETVSPKVGPYTKERRMVEALESPFAAGEVHLRLTTLFGNVPQTSFVRTLLHIDVRDLTFMDQPDGWHQATFDVLASSYGENGLIADYLSRTETIRARGRTYGNLLRYGLNYNLLVPIKKPGPYQLRAAVRDSATDRVGSAYQFIEVPDLKNGRLALSGIGISSAVLNLAAVSADSAVYNATAQEGESAQPTPAVRRFKAGTLMDYGYVIYNALPGPGNALPDLRAEIRLFHEGELVASQDEQAIDTGRLELDLKRLSAKGRLRLSDQLIPGQYVLQIVVRDPQAKEKNAIATQWIDFEVVK